MKKHISIILIIMLLVCNINVNCYAMELPNHDFNYDSLESYWKLMQDVGFIVSYPAYSAGKTLGSILKKYLNSVEAGSGDNITSDEDAGNWARNNISINGDGNIVLNDNAKAFINYSINDFVDNNPAYIYTYNNENCVSYFSNTLMYVKTVNLVRTLQDQYYCLCVLRDDSNGPWMWCIGKNKYPYLCAVANNFYRPPYMIKCQLFDGLTREDISEADKYYHWDKNTKDYVELSASENRINYYPYMTLDPSLGFNLMTNDTGWTRGTMFTVGGSTPIRYFRSVSDINAESVLYQSYYYNNSVYNNWNNSIGDYTVTNDNSNKTSYGDITSYIDSYNTENGYPPNPSTIEIHIHNENNPVPTPTPTPDNPSGGGGNNGGTVSGNTNNGGSASASATANNSGVNVTVNNNHNINLNVPGLSGNSSGSGTVSGNGNGSGGIFDWISDIGCVIGEFIKNVGSLIADVINGITETITTILADIPNIISVLVEFVYGGLPDELKAIVTLGITTVIFVGVIKMMRK